MKSAKNTRVVLRPAMPEMELEECVIRVNHTHGHVVEAVVCKGVVVAGELQAVEAPTMKQFTGAEYAELLSGNPSWALGKPEGTFRDLDILAFLDELAVRPKPEPVRQEGPLNTLVSDLLKAQAQGNPAAQGGNK